MTLYVDGILSGELDISGYYTGPLCDAPLFLGNIWAYASIQENINLDEIAIFNRAVSDAEIWALSKNPLPKRVIGAGGIICPDGQTLSEYLANL